MAKTLLKSKDFCFGKSISFFVLLLRLLCGLSSVLSQKGFLSIDCGARENYTDRNNISWVSDAHYIKVGRTVRTPNSSALPFELQSVRLFPNPLNKSCYELPVTANTTYLLRLSFYWGSHAPPNFYATLEAEGAFFLLEVNFSKPRVDATRSDLIFRSSSQVINICLCRKSDNEDPFISAIELRQLSHGMYKWVRQGKVLLRNLRVDYGGESPIRYPQDIYDRIWSPVKTFYTNLSTIASISDYKTNNFPPIAVMKTALTPTEKRGHLGLSLSDDIVQNESEKSVILLYFAEIERFNVSESRIFDISINGKIETLGLNPLERSGGTYDTSIEVPIEVKDFRSLEVVLKPTADSTRGPIINALEHYVVFDSDIATLSEDVKALSGIKRAFGLTDWISDPCYVIEWNGIQCSDINLPGPPRIWNINLSWKNLNGTIPPDIGRLTALRNLFLDHNNLQGPFPDFRNLKHLERIHLQNNMLSGAIPKWLTRLDNLKELILENNNFSGDIPPELLKRKLNFRFNNNTLLKIPSHPNRTRLVVGLTIGITILTGNVALILAIVFLKKRAKKKEINRERHGSSIHTKLASNGHVQSVEDEDYSVVIVPNPTKSRAFTYDEIMTATENFTKMIGKGGFGSVYYGKLPDGKNVAVKVLSLFSRQGVQEFLNEVDLLSRVHHKNLVALLGYCNESRELMLIYEHMPGGSLEEHLYDSVTELVKLDWKTRLQIALDTAHGLEYLQVKCTPRIIHRDIKTSNILLDRDLTGKLADFGLSKTTMDGGASHITTTVKGTAGYIDPEYFSTHMLTEMSDVYSFGVVLLEIVCGRQPINTNLPEEEINLIRWVKPHLEEEDPKKLAEIVDKRMASNYDIKSVFMVANLAIRCVQAAPTWRPTISQIVSEIKEAINLQNLFLIQHSEDIDMKHGELQLQSSSVFTSTDSNYVKKSGSN